VHYVRQGHGQSGQNRDYVIETVRALEGLGYRETKLHLIAERLGKHETEIRHQERGGAILIPDP
jgi:cation transport protein ChaC